MLSRQVKDTLEELTNAFETHYGNRCNVVSSSFHKHNGCQYTITAYLLVNGKRNLVHVKVCKPGAGRLEAEANMVLQTHLDNIGTLWGLELRAIHMISTFEATIRLNNMTKQYLYIVLEGMYDSFETSKTLPTRLETLREFQETLSLHPEMGPFDMDLDGINVEIVKGKLLVFDVKMKKPPRNTTNVDSCIVENESPSPARLVF